MYRVWCPMLRSVQSLSSKYKTYLGVYKTSFSLKYKTSHCYIYKRQVSSAYPIHPHQESNYPIYFSLPQTHPGLDQACVHLTQRKPTNFNRQCIPCETWLHQWSELGSLSVTWKGTNYSQPKVGNEPEKEHVHSGAGMAILRGKRSVSKHGSQLREKLKMTQIHFEKLRWETL